MLHKLVLPSIVLIASGLLAACATPTPESTATVLQKFVAAFNAKDQTAVMALFSDACEVYRRNYYYAGRPEIAAWLRESIENYRDHYELIEIKAQGNRATGLFRITSAGSERFYLPGDYFYTFQAEVIAGKLTCLNVGQLDPGICW